MKKWLMRNILSNNKIFNWTKRRINRSKEACAIKRLDKFRKEYDKISFQKLVKKSNIWLHQYPEQASYNLSLIQLWFENYVSKPAFVLEIGGWRGDLAKTILHDYIFINCWDNFDIISDASTQKCSDERYQLVPLSDYIWNIEVEKKYNALIASHMIEHIKWHELTQLIRWIPDNIHTVLFEAPIVQSAQNYSWKGHFSNHILEKGWEQVIEEMRNCNFVEVFSEKDTVIFTRI